MYVRVLKFFLNILLLVTNIRPEQDCEFGYGQSNPFAGSELIKVMYPDPESHLVLLKRILKIISTNYTTE